MKKILYAILLFVFLFIGSSDIYAVNKYEHSSGGVTVKCNVSEKSFNVYIDSNMTQVVQPNTIYYKNNAKKLNLNTQIDINGRKYSEIYYVDVNGGRLYIEPLLINDLTQNNDCLEMQIGNFSHNELNTGGHNFGVVYFDTSSITTPTLVSQYKLNCEQYMEWFEGPIFKDSDNYINIYKDGTGYFLAIDNYRRPLTQYGENGWCDINDYNCIKAYTTEYTIQPSVCGYPFDTTHLLDGFNELDNDVQNLVGNNIYLYYRGGGLGYISNTDKFTYPLKDTLKPYTGNEDIFTDPNLFSCTYEFSSEVYRISYSPIADKFSIPTFQGNLSLDPVRGNLAKNIKNKICQQTIYLCHDRSKYEYFFVDYADYIKDYNDEKLFSCVPTKTYEEDITNISISRYYARIKNALQIIAPSALNYDIYIDDSKTTLNNVEASNGICSPELCKDAPEEYLKKGMLEITDYCNKIFTITEDNAVRQRDCLAYKKFYDKLVKDGILSDYASGCSFVSVDLQEKLIWILNILKVAGPILALGLGTLDFIKAVASGDADKEMKTAFKRFSTRIAAAALLFVIPLILAFLMETFLGNQDGYNEDNPFCNIVEWK